MVSLTALPRWGFGGAAIGGLYRPVDAFEAQAAVHAGLSADFGLIDTAPYYGHGLSELRLGEALRAWTGPRPMISSKVGRVLDPAEPDRSGRFGFFDTAPFVPRFDYSRDGVRRSLEGSFERLGVAKLDAALVHDVGAATHGVEHERVLRQVLDETLPELERAREQGLVDRIGLGVNEWEVCVAVMQRARIDCVLLAGRYTLLEQPALTSGMLNLCVEQGVSVMAAGVFNSGLLATPPGAASMYNYEAASADIVAKAQAIWRVCAEHGVAPQAAALAFPALHPAVSTVIVGMRSAAEVAEIAAWRSQPIPPALWDDLKRGGFIDASAPTA